MKTIKPANLTVYDVNNVGTMKVDYRMHCYDVITNPNWWRCRIVIPITFSRCCLWSRSVMLGSAESVNKMS